MPAGLIPNEGLALMLSELLGSVPISVVPWQLLLWVNDIVPTVATVYGDLHEATFGGYGRANLDREAWQVPTVSAGCAKSVWGTDPVVFTVTGGPLETIRGCAYLDSLNGVLRFVQRFDPADIVTLQPDAKYKVPPVFTLTSAEC